MGSELKEPNFLSICVRSANENGTWTRTIPSGPATSRKGARRGADGGDGAGPWDCVNGGLKGGRVGEEDRDEEPAGGGWRDL